MWLLEPTDYLLQLNAHSSPKILVSFTTLISVSTSVISPEGLYFLNEQFIKLEGTGLLQSCSVDR